MHVGASAENETRLMEYEQSAAASLDLNLNAHALKRWPHARLHVSGTAELAGSISLSFLPYAVPTPVGRKFEIVSGDDGVHGRFSAFDFQPPHSGFWRVDGGPKSVALQVVEMLAERTVERLLEIFIHLEEYRGTGQLFLP